MSVDMYVSSSQRQATSVTKMCQKQIQGYEELQRAIDSFVLTSPMLTGATYDSAKQFFISVLQPLSRGGILLSEAVMEACQKFPEEYLANVDSGDLKESDLREKIARINRLTAELSELQDRLHSLLFRQQQNGTLDGSIASRMSSNHSLMATYEQVKRKLQEKLDDLLEFNGRSPDIFAEIEGLKSAVNTGASVATGSWNSRAGVFTMPKKKDMAWVNDITTIQNKRDLAQFEGCQLIYHPGTSEVASYYSVSKIGNSVEENNRLTNLYHQMVKDGKLNVGTLTGMKIRDISAEDMLVKKTDDLNVVYQKYILCASKGIHPHTGEKLTTSEKNKFLYAGMVTPTMDAIGQFYGAYMGKKMADKLMRDAVKEAKYETGGRTHVPDPYDEFLKWEQAEDRYNEIRSFTNDIEKITENTGIPSRKIERIKDHVFYKEHAKDHGYGRFDADPDIADAWNRLRDGKYNKNDLDLLEHEYFESRFESLFETDYRTSHDKTIESKRIWDPLKERE